MTIATPAHALYGQARALKSPRELEYEVFARVTGLLRRALAASGPAAFPARAAALHDNRRLWTTLAFDLAHPGNGLPRDLRARLAWLATYVVQAGERGLRLGEEGDAAIGSVIEINTLVMRGLRPGGAE